MKFIRVLFGLILFVLLFATAGYVLYAAFACPAWKQSMEWLQTSTDARFTVATGAGVFILLGIIYVLAGVQRKCREEFISFENEGGAVSISMKAVRDYVGRVADEYAAVLSLEPAIRAPSGKIEVELNVRVKSGTQIPELCRLMQERVKETLHDTLGLPEVRNVRVNVREIVASTPEGKPPAKPEEGMEGWEGSMRT